MKKYISFLRGINVGGYNKIKMDELKKCYESLAFTEVSTFIQSGNVIFKSPDKADAVTSKLEKGIKQYFGMDVSVILRTPAELEKIISSAPYTPAMIKDTKYLYIILFKEAPAASDAAGIESAKYQPDQFFLKGKEVYLYLPNGMGKTKLSNNFFEKKLNIPGTARNWNTINELIRLSE